MLLLHSHHENSIRLSNPFSKKDRGRLEKQEFYIKKENETATRKRKKNLPFPFSVSSFRPGVTNVEVIH